MPPAANGPSGREWWALALQQDTEGDGEPPHIRLLRKAWDKVEVPASDGVVFSSELADDQMKYPARHFRSVGLKPSSQRRENIAK